jgi:DNA-binding MarR family transcriptional regulator
MGRRPTSHFHVVTELERLLSTLELNFFITKYYEMRDRDGRKVSVFSLNYGLCQKYTIAFGRPSGVREFRLYFVERVFDYTPILQRHLEENQEIKCDNCHAIYGLDKLASLELYHMQCPACRMGKCVVSNLSKKYATMIREIDPNLLLPRTEIGILQTLHSEGRPLYAGDIAGELDCSYQLVGKRGRNLAERGLVDRSQEQANQRRTIRITKAAEQTYFKDNGRDDLEVKK